jgi:hypothetical protein
MSEIDASCLKSDLHKCATEISVAMQACQRTGQLSRYMLLHEAREALYKAIRIPARDERQLTLETSTEGQPNADANS